MGSQRVGHNWASFTFWPNDTCGFIPCVQFKGSKDELVTVHREVRIVKEQELIFIKRNNWESTNVKTLEKQYGVCTWRSGCKAVSWERLLFMVGPKKRCLKQGTAVIAYYWRCQCIPGIYRWHVFHFYTVNCPHICVSQGEQPIDHV